MAFISVMLVITFLLLISSKILERFYVPSIIAMMLVGILLGPHGINFIEKFLIFIGKSERLSQINYTIETFNIFGLVFIMALAGLETDLAILKREKKALILLSVLTVFIPIIAGVLTSIYLKLNLVGILLFASVFASHSVGLIFPLIKELHIEKTRFGVAVLGATMITDIISIIILSISIQFQRQQSLEMMGTISLFDRINFGNNGILMVLTFIFFLTVYMALSFLVFPRFLHDIAIKFKTVKLHSPLVFMFIILIFIVMGELLGINLVVGAFVAGISISFSGVLSKYEDIDKILNNIGYGVFVPFMFYYIGTQTNIHSLFQVKISPLQL